MWYVMFLFSILQQENPYCFLIAFQLSAIIFYIFGELLMKRSGTKHKNDRYNEIVRAVES